MATSVGFLPLRKGSKGIPGKNKRKMAGRPLFTWVLNEAAFSKLDAIYVATDDNDIQDFIKTHYKHLPKIKLFERSEASATDTASTEMALEEFYEAVGKDFEVLCLLQATSPTTTQKDINCCLAALEKGKDSALTVVNTHRFVWNTEGAPLNYDPSHRPRRQDFEGLLVENGAVYATTASAFKKTKTRISGSIELVTMPEISYTEIDSETDWLFVEQLLVKRLQQQKGTAKITHLVLDVDGVFTPGTVWYGKEGELAKSFDMRDGMGLELLREKGIEVLIMTSENSELVAQRMKKLKIKEVFLGVKDKYHQLQYVCDTQGISPDQIAYVGDDVNDMAAMAYVSWSFAPQNAMIEIKNIADVTLSHPSGGGAIREVCQFIEKYNLRYA
ncbi:MAG: cytidyltransferase [Alteromonas sp.]|nr:cytidyltransferase [Alteromonas sp.]MAY23649.1 cytidyltransferase [Flavobacteriaceae bacterium]|tara:strand:- start:39584 stop:40744 length:1161 start_codon:yes stop_codon:yes gene_type:complete